MSALKLALRLSGAALAIVWLISPVCVVGQSSTLPVATGIVPGDVVINDAFNHWIKFDPMSNQFFSLPWARNSSISEKFVFDKDGAILQLLTPASSQGSIMRIHPVTGVATTFGPASIQSISDFDIAPSGDLILTRPATNAQISGGVWSGGSDGELYVYSRQTNQLAPLPKPQHYSPETVAVSPAGETYIGEFFRDVAQVEIPSGTVTTVPSSVGVRNVIDVFGDGDILIEGAPGTSFRRLDPIAGTAMLLIGSPTALSVTSLAVDGQGNVWLGAQNRLDLVNGLTGAISTRGSLAGFFPLAMAIVPADWTPPPIPEPATCVLAASGLLGLVAVRRRN